MPPCVILLATKGGLKGHEFELCRKTRCLVGRACDCELLLPGDDLTVSRHHCLVDVDAPSVTVYDLNSRNGTYVNGERVLPVGDLAPEGPAQGRALKVGDEVALGDTVLRVWIVEPGEVSAEDGSEEGPAANLCGACC
jgi:pSer/pThr/pTyr-binding forkhead associated (FHA) protein